MVRLPAGWREAGAFTGLSGSGPSRGVVHHPIPRLAIGDYGQVIQGVPIQNGQGTTLISASGAGEIMGLGPTGLGNVWYPAQCTVSTTTGVLDSSTFELFLGPVGVPITLVGTLFPGGAGTIALAIPPMTPGQYLIGLWSGGTPGDVASMNIIGTMSALAPG